MKRLFLTFTLVAAFLTGFTSPAGAVPITGHCKDADHLAVAGPTGTVLGPNDVTLTTTSASAGDCVNDPSYSGVIYQLTIPSGPHSTKTLNMKPDGASGVCNYFVYASWYIGTADLRHTNGGILIRFGTFDTDAQGVVIYTYHLYGLC